MQRKPSKRSREENCLAGLPALPGARQFSRVRVRVRALLDCNIKTLSRVKKAFDKFWNFYITNFTKGKFQKYGISNEA